eukprot:6202724-Pleurochrysis_carterae.AAC.4
MLETRKTQGGAGGPKDCKCGKGAKGARQEGHESGQEERIGSGAELVSDDNHGDLLILFLPHPHQRTRGPRVRLNSCCDRASPKSVYDKCRFNLQSDRLCEISVSSTAAATYPRYLACADAGTRQ